MVDEGINSLGQLEKDLGKRSSMLSNYITGKNVPEMEFIEKCIKRFKLEGTALKDIFSRAFSSTARANQKIILDTRYFKEDRIELLVQIITLLLLAHPTLSLPYGSRYIELGDDIKNSYNVLDSKNIKDFENTVGKNGT
jgi:hypothetical protein